MPPVAADIRAALQIAATAIAALLALTASQLTAKAQTQHMLIIPASDGYGFDDCLAGNKPCGRTIADAWCEAHGMTASISFGRSDDVTATIADGAGKPPRIEAGAFIVNCKD